MLDSLLKFAKEGLRTLVIAKKTIPKEHVDDILLKVKQINMSTKKDKADDFLDLYKNIEQDFNFIGASAIEDKLQEVFLLFNINLNQYNREFQKLSNFL